VKEFTVTLVAHLELSSVCVCVCLCADNNQTLEQIITFDLIIW